MLAAIIVAIIAYVVFSQSASNSVIQESGDQSISEQQNPPASNAKINIDAVCQGALAYMTFPDAAAAEVFVSECKEGKHPEVIEQYKAQMNLGDGAAI
mgnify:FL=1